MENNYMDRIVCRLYFLMVVIALFTGFGNMPIYKRYYISNIPGLEWSSNFYINLYVHYIAGALLLGIAVYYVVIFMKYSSAIQALTVTGKIRAGTLGLLLSSGLLLALRNLNGIDFTFGFQMGVSFIHLGTAMLFLVVTIVCGLTRCSKKK